MRSTPTMLRISFIAILPVSSIAVSASPARSGFAVSTFLAAAACTVITLT
ncbi:hypothetical protein GCM10020219_008200 [Nonomuraea dietziae]